VSHGAAIPAEPGSAEVQARLGSWSVFAGVLAAAGIPIYIHAPKVYVDSYGVSLASLGLVLFALRLLDVVQDPALGWLSERLRARRQASVAVALGLMAAAMVGLFAVSPPVAPLLWFAITLTLLFSAFSFLTITYYAEGVAKAGSLGSEGHLRLAAWRESGALGGICIAAALPSILAGMDLPIGLYAVAFVLACAVASVVMRGEWGRRASMPAEPGFRRVLADPVSRRLLLLALINAMPVAVTSTLFLYFVESRLAAPGWEGPLLLLFFLSAAAWAPSSPSRPSRASSRSAPGMSRSSPRSASCRGRPSAPTSR
jgi:glycoside/pentoside/hexuronide:cation symporter, GPH family